MKKLLLAAEEDEERMTKRVSLSFDDGRWDMYANAFPIMKRYGLTGTVNIITDFTNNPEKYTFKSCKKGSITKNQVMEMYCAGFEIAAHGHTHHNSPDDIRECLKELKAYGIIEKPGFASPQSYYCVDNREEVMQMLKNGEIRYVRTGIQTKREGTVYAALTFLERKTHSKLLYYYLNKRCYIKDGMEPFFLSASVTCYTTVEQIQYLIEKMKNEDTLVLNFHSILNKEDPGYGCGEWFWDADKFDRLCMELSSDNNIKVINTIEIAEG